MGTVIRSDTGHRLACSAAAAAITTVLHADLTAASVRPWHGYVFPLIGAFVVIACLGAGLGLIPTGGPILACVAFWTAVAVMSLLHGTPSAAVTGMAAGTCAVLTAVLHHRPPDGLPGAPR